MVLGILGGSVLGSSLASTVGMSNIGKLISQLSGAFPVGFLGGAGYGSGLRFGFEKIFDAIFKNIPTQNVSDTIKIMQGGFGIGNAFAQSDNNNNNSNRTITETISTLSPGVGSTQQLPQGPAPPTITPPTIDSAINQSTPAIGNADKVSWVDESTAATILTEHILNGWKSVHTSRFVYQPVNNRQSKLASAKLWAQQNLVDKNPRSYRYFNIGINNATNTIYVLALP